jgi:hypothetical protein
MKMKPRFYTQFVILENKDGLFVHPTNNYDDYIFCKFGYHSKEEALNRITELKYISENIFILEKVYVSWDIEK